MPRKAGSLAPPGRFDCLLRVSLPAHGVKIHDPPAMSRDILCAVNYHFPHRVILACHYDTHMPEWHGIYPQGKFAIVDFVGDLPFQPVALILL